MSDPQSPETPRSQNGLLAHLLDSDVDLDDAFDRLVSDQETVVQDVALCARVSGDALASEELTLGALLASVLTEYQDIEQLIEGLREQEVADLEMGDEAVAIDGAVAIVSEADLADPEALGRAVAPLQADLCRFESLFETARNALNHLDVYGLSRMSTAELVAVLRRQGSLDTVQSLVGFLRSLHTAADSFESLELPKPHIQDYLQHFYLMRDWREMARLIGVLELSVAGLQEVEAPRLVLADSPGPGMTSSPLDSGATAGNRRF